MTKEELEKLSPDEKRVKIAEACGWKSELVPTPNPYGEFQHTWWTSPEGKRPEILPDYLNSLDAMAAVEKTLSDEQCDRYLEHLTETSGGDAENGKSSFCGYVATAEQRSDAFLLTIPTAREQDAAADRYFAGRGRL